MNQLFAVSWTCTDSLMQTRKKKHKILPDDNFKQLDPVWFHAFRYIPLPILDLQLWLNINGIIRLQVKGEKQHCCAARESPALCLFLRFIHHLSVPDVFLILKKRKKKSNFVFLLNNCWVSRSQKRKFEKKIKFWPFLAFVISDPEAKRDSFFMEMQLCRVQIVWLFLSACIVGFLTAVLYDALTFSLKDN